MTRFKEVIVQIGLLICWFSNPFSTMAFFTTNFYVFLTFKLAS